MNSKLILADFDRRYKTKNHPDHRPSRWSGSVYSADVIEGIDVCTVIVDGEVQVRAGRPAGGADVADGLSLCDVIADGHGAGRLVRVEAGIAVAVVDDHIIAPGCGIGRRRDCAGFCRKDRRTEIGRASCRERV